MKRIIFCLFTIFLIANSCGKVENKVERVGKDYFQTYSERKNIDKIVSFYSDDFQYENVIFGTKTDDAKELFSTIYNWKNSDFKFESKETINLKALTVSDSVIIAAGSMKPYLYREHKVEEMDFVIQLYLDEDSKIKKQIDWFDYPVEEIIQMHLIKESIQIE